MRCVSNESFHCFDDYNYWSSTENSTSNAFKLNFNNGNQNTNTKSNTQLVRAARIKSYNNLWNNYLIL